MRDGEIALDRKCQLMFVDIGLQPLADLSEHKLDIRFWRESEQTEFEVIKLFVAKRPDPCAIG